MEACCGAHYWSRVIGRFGHPDRLIAPQFVKPCVKSNKHDLNDAEASLIGRSKVNGLGSEAYLRNALSCIADHPVDHTRELLPWDLATNPAEQSLHAA
jgi:hypothetical protein